jgi:aspartate/methionine/tyrosine aminotransferase
MKRDASTALQFGDDIFVVQSFSKYFNMTGWRLGWLVVPERFARDIEKLAQNLFISPSTPAQYAALAAFARDDQHPRGTRARSSAPARLPRTGAREPRFPLTGQAGRCLLPLRRLQRN